MNEPNRTVIGVDLPALLLTVERLQAQLLDESRQHALALGDIAELYTRTHAEKSNLREALDATRKQLEDLIWAGSGGSHEFDLQAARARAFLNEPYKSDALPPPEYQCMDCGVSGPGTRFYPIAWMSRPDNARFPGHQLCLDCEKLRRATVGGSLIVGPDPRIPQEQDQP